MTRYRDRGFSRQGIPALVTAALVAPLMGCGPSRVAGASQTDATPSPASTSRTAVTVGPITPSPISVPPVPTAAPSSAPCLRPGDAATLTNSDLAPSEMRLCLKPNEHVTVRLTPPTAQVWDSHNPPRLKGGAVALTSVFSGNVLQLHLTAVQSGQATVTATGVAVHGPAGASWVIMVTVG